MGIRFYTRHDLFSPDAGAVRRKLTPARAGSLSRMHLRDAGMKTTRIPRTILRGDHAADGRFSVGKDHQRGMRRPTI